MLGNIGEVYSIFAALLAGECLLFFLKNQEDITAKLTEFLIEPHGTTSELISEKQQVPFRVSFFPVQLPVKQEKEG